MHVTPPPQGPTPPPAPVYDALVRSWRDDGRSVPEGRVGPAPCPPGAGPPPRDRPAGYQVRPYGVDLSRFGAR